MDLSVITVTWNAEELIERQIASVALASKKHSIEHIVVDNGSKDSTVALIRKRFPSVTVIQNLENKGFGAANNQALPHATGEFLLFLNPDMRLEPGSLDPLVEIMRARPSVGVVSCKLVHENGEVHRDALPRRFPRVRDMMVMILKLHHLFPSLLDRYLMRDIDPDKERAVDSVRGSFLLVRREIAERLGWAFDPRYFIWFEDVDTCREVRRLGYTVLYTPVVSAVDYVGQSFKKMKTLPKQKQFTKSMLVYFKKWEPWWKWMWIAALRPVGIFFAWLRDIIRS